MRNKSLAVPGYLIAALLIIVPLVDSLLSIWPLQPGQVAWRFGAVGLMSRALMTPFLGVLVAYAIALALEHRKTLRVISVLNGVLVIALLGGISLFTLDALQMRADVVPQAKTAFDVASALALAKYGFGVIIGLAFAIAGWRASRKPKVEKRSEAKAGGMLIGTRPEATVSRAEVPAAV